MSTGNVTTPIHDADLLFESFFCAPITFTRIYTSTYYMTYTHGQYLSSPTAPVCTGRSVVAVLGHCAVAKGPLGKEV